MFCPKCKAEYREGFLKCADCDIELVLALPKDPKPEYIVWVEVLSTFNNGDIAILKSLLECENINYYFHGEYFNSVRPWVQPAILMVDKKDIMVVKELIKDLKLSFRGTALDNDQDENNGTSI
ncbi:MAG: hypothetical protein SV375_11550 [Thermodesulfobacteriota bacterium]|nr:hypothetical protein [Thermodesulfobacteriota bacterium]